MADKAEVKKVKGDCPWCNLQGVDSKVEPDRQNYQCLTCGKHWNKEGLGKEWSLELERGESWAREDAARKLKR